MQDKVRRKIGFSKQLKTRLGRLFIRSNRHLFVELVRAKFKITDHNSILGILWNIILPISTMVILYFVFRSTFEHQIRAYPFYILLGLSVINFFTMATSHITKLFSSNREVILNSTISREIFILADIAIPIYKFIIELIICFGFSVFYGFFSVKFFLLIPLLISYIVFILGAGMILSLIYCFIRDIEHVWFIFCRLLLFITPIFYKLEGLSFLMRKVLYIFNPLVPFLISFRQIFMFEDKIDMINYSYSLLFGGFFFILGYMIFISFENIAMEKA